MTYSLSDLITQANEVLNELLDLIQKRIKAQGLHIMIADTKVDGVPVTIHTSGWGDVSPSNPSDDDIGAFSAQQCNDFASQVKGDAEAQQAHGGN